MITLTFQGRRASASEWAKTEWCQRRHISASMIRTRKLMLGWSDEDTLTTPYVPQEERFQRKKRYVPAAPRTPLTPPQIAERIARMRREWQHLLGDV